jgi:glycosyltransferase involved in cell wall biosynthesis
MINGKYKVLMLSDHALSTSGVGTQSRHLIQGLLKKNTWSFRQFGAAMKHDSYETIKMSDDFIIKPIDGFGNKELLRMAIATEQPDVIFLFTDPRFYYWLFEMEDEIHQMCPIVYWHVWDNKPYPEFNDAFYEATDLINCHSHHTYSQIKERWPRKTNFVPHSLPQDIFYQISDFESAQQKEKIIGKDRADHFVLFWMNRNARRKRPGDLLYSFKLFLDELYKKEGHRKATLLMHTDPNDKEGPNLFAVSDHLGLKDNVVFSNQRVDFNTINLLHNISDVCINISYAEGFGLSTLEAMQTGTPIIAPLTGGQTRQVVNAYTGEENGVALPIEMQTLVGSQSVPYIFEDMVSNETISKAIMKMYDIGPEARRELGQKAKQYALTEFGYDKVVDLWHNTMLETILTWKHRRKNYSLTEV